MFIFIYLFPMGEMRVAVPKVEVSQRKMSNRKGK
jgi:hypothetical protein